MQTFDGQIDESKRPVFSGEVLMCEDNAINQHIVKTLLSKLGLDLTIAVNGEEGVALVSERLKKGSKPFDLIFMDIEMPVMDGIEAADELNKIGSKTPVVALTANTEAEECEKYKAHGMQDYLCKPFTNKELWTCLFKYFTPVRYEDVNSEAENEEDVKQKTKLYTSFVTKNQHTYHEICEAVETGDIKLAHRLAHTLRGLAGLMKRAELQDSARAVETALTEGKNPTDEQMKALDRDLKTVLDELAPYLETSPEADPATVDKVKAAKILAELEPILKGYNARCQEYVSGLKSIPFTRELVAQVEEYEFDAALEILPRVKKLLEI